MPSDWDAYQIKLNKIATMHDQEVIERSEENPSGFPPQDDTQFKHEIITPIDPSQLNISRGLRTSNLNPYQLMAVTKAGLFLSWINSVKGTFNLSADKNLLDLEEEVKRDVSFILNTAPSAKGWLINNMFAPKKKWEISGERAKSKLNVFNRREEESG